MINDDFSLKLTNESVLAAQLAAQLKLGRNISLAAAMQEAYSLIDMCAVETETRMIQRMEAEAKRRNTEIFVNPCARCGHEVCQCPEGQGDDDNGE